MLRTFLVRKKVDYRVWQHGALINVRLLATDALFMIPFSKDSLFVGREDIIGEISEKRKQAALRNHTRLALIGLGGVG
jgi:hypothetical protein